MDIRLKMTSHTIGRSGLFWHNISRNVTALRETFRFSFSGDSCCYLIASLTASANILSYSSSFISSSLLFSSSFISGSSSCEDSFSSSSSASPSSSSFSAPFVVRGSLITFSYVNTNWSVSVTSFEFSCSLPASDECSLSSFVSESSSS